MRFEKYYSFKVPCITKIEKKNSQRQNLGTLYKNPRAVFRFEPHGVTVCSSLFTPCKGDENVADILKQEEIDSRELPPDILDLMLAKDVLKNSYLGQPRVTTIPNDLTIFYAILEVTQHCNLSCEQCYFGGGRNKEQPPSFNELMSRVKTLSEMGITFLEVTGGEPTLREDLGELLYEIDRKGMTFYLPTNGVRISNLPKNVLEKSGTISVSIDGDEFFHDKARGGRGAYKTAIKTLEYLYEQDIRPLICMTIWEENAKFTDHVTRLGKQYDADVMLQHVVETERAKENRLTLLSIEGRFKEDCTKEEDGIKIYQKRLRMPKEGNSEAYLYGCDFGRKTFAVTVDGRVLPCVYNRGFDVGRLDDHNAISLNNTFNDLVQNAKSKLTPCNRCEYENCGGPCHFSRLYVKWLS